MYILIFLNPVTIQVMRFCVWGDLRPIKFNFNLTRQNILSKKLCQVKNLRSNLKNVCSTIKDVILSKVYI